MQIQLKVDYHPSGRRTLKKRTQNEMMFTDCSGPLLSNSDVGSFYRAVAAVLYKHHTAGDTVEYDDTHLDMTRKAAE
ncbi:hypothetical protein ACFFTM_09570 [Pseudoduganella plicata]|uniref:Uncharacterized protein n=1 Tax=Pseudoduganella plicata TaxID=321984 RepID=A0A4P7B9R0_9BURK|nr:hypothetical protein [Pseudoduganella plicata]QBQ35291.1 hypothetical protein E1742_03270 [Pseudoduganella plicata]GGZ00618.1 hypothetical protein GCM10007388_37650 [Pseudoduganella plicata]